MKNEDSSGSLSFCFQIPATVAVTVQRLGQADLSDAGPSACTPQGPGRLHGEILHCRQLVRGAREAQSFECPVFYFYKVSLWHSFTAKVRRSFEFSNKIPQSPASSSSKVWLVQEAVVRVCAKAGSRAAQRPRTVHLLGTTKTKSQASQTVAWGHGADVPRHLLFLNTFPFFLQRKGPLFLPLYGECIGNDNRKSGNNGTFYYLIRTLTAECVVGQSAKKHSLPHPSLKESFMLLT